MPGALDTLFLVRNPIRIQAARGSAPVSVAFDRICGHVDPSGFSGMADLDRPALLAPRTRAEPPAPGRARALAPGSNGQRRWAVRRRSGCGHGLPLRPLEADP